MKTTRILPPMNAAKQLAMIRQGVALLTKANVAAAPVKTVTRDASFFRNAAKEARALLASSTTDRQKEYYLARAVCQETLAARCT